MINWKGDGGPVSVPVYVRRNYGYLQEDAIRIADLGIET
jgi:hypothetical protein